MAGLETLYPENDLRDLLIKDLETNIDAFQNEDIDGLSYEALRRWVKWVGSVEVTLDRAESIVEHGRSLLTVENVSPLLQVLESREDIELFRDYLKRLTES